MLTFSNLHLYVVSREAEFSVFLGQAPEATATHAYCFRLSRIFQFFTEAHNEVGCSDAKEAVNGRSKRSELFEPGNVETG